MRRAEVWDIPDTDDRTARVLVLSPGDVNATYQVAIVLKLIASDAPDTVLSIPVGGTIDATAFALNIAQLRAARFDPAAGATRIGSATDAEMARIDNALRIVLEL